VRATIGDVVTALALLAVTAVLFAAAALATREEPLLSDAPPDSADLGLPDGPLAPEHVAAVRFPTTVRGYRMSEVDHVLERLAESLRERDERIAALEKRTASA
jgi:DivIVA domain-containing protein